MMRRSRRLRSELAEMTDPEHDGHELFYEYHS